MRTIPIITTAKIGVTFDDNCTDIYGTLDNLETLIHDKLLEKFRVDLECEWQGFTRNNYRIDISEKGTIDFYPGSYWEPDDYDNCTCLWEEDYKELIDELPEVDGVELYMKDFDWEGVEE